MAATEEEGRPRPDDQPPLLTTYGGTAVPVDPSDPLLDTAVRRVAAGAGDDRPYGRPGRPLAERTPLRTGFSAALGVGLAVVLLLAVAEARGVLLLIATATALAVGLDPAVRAVQRTGLPRAWAVALVSLVLLLGVAGALLALVPPVVDQTGDFVGALPGYLDRLTEEERVAELEAEYGVVERAQDYLTSNDLGQQALGGVVGAGRVVLGVLASVVTVLVLTVYLLASLPTLKQTAYRLVPRSRRPRVGLLADEILRRVGGYVAGQLAVALTAGTAALVWLLVLDVPFAAALALVVALGALVPLVGASLAALVVSAVVLASTSAGAALATLLFFLVYQQIENYYLYPRVMLRTVKVSPVATVIAVLLGGTLLGVLGALLALPVTAAVQLVVEEVVVPRQDRS